jgi:death-on-curing protein
LAIKETEYVSYAEAVLIHVLLMRFLGELHYGVFDRSLVESALARPKQAASYEGADLLRQSATLCYGLIKNHRWVGGNKRTATAIAREFLRRNGMKLSSATGEIIRLVTAIESDRWGVNEIEDWFRERVTKVKL